MGSRKEGGCLISGDILRGYCDTIILHILLEGNSYGYKISKTIEARSDGWFAMKETTLYSAMARLEKRGWVTSYHGDESFGKRRTYYAVTERGADYYREKCAEWRLTKKVINRFTTESEEEKKNEQRD